MKLGYFSLAAAVVALALTAPASAAEGYYGSIGADYVSPTTDYVDDGYGGNVALGYDAGAWRGELELAYLDLSTSPYDVSVTAATIAVYYDLPLADDWTLSAGAGVGLAQTNVSYYGYDYVDSTDLTYKGAVQLAYDLNDTTQLYAGYTYRAVDTDYDTLDAHSFGVGVRFDFGA